MDERAVLISVRPRFANAILDAKKTVELRRIKINVPAGTRFLIYSTSPVMAVIGTAILERVETDTPENLWCRVKDLADVSQDEYAAYFAGATEAVALYLSEPTTLERPISLERLRNSVGIEPSQSFRYLDLAQVDLITPSAVAS
jgi:predicted transcriptional regulator